MRYERGSDTVCISVSELASYAFQRENPAVLSERYGFVKKIITSDEDGGDIVLPSAEHGVILHSITETDASLSSAQTEVPLEKRMEYGDFSLSVSGYADIISPGDGVHTVEEIKTVSSFPRGLSALSYPEHFAQAAVYAYIYAETAALPEVDVRLSYIKRSNGEKVMFTSRFSLAALTKMFETLLSRAYVIINAFADRYRVFPTEADKLPFPYTSVREGQLEFINQAYRVMKKGGSLLVSAPTGIGKTMSALFSGVKALGSGAADRIFYLTAKNITGKAAVEALARITKYAPHLRSVMICAKEIMCPYSKSKDVKMNCRYCDKTDSSTEDFGKTYISYRERQLAALDELLLDKDTVFTVDRITKAAAEHNVCPYELALDLSESCEIIICDYNYVIDDGIRFMRYFKNVKNTEKYIFLFDEAHNLPDRTRNTYSAVLSTDDAEKLRTIAETYITDDTELVSRIDELSSALDEICAMCTDSEYVKSTDDGEISYGFYESSTAPSELIRCAGNLSRVLRRIIRDGSDYTELLEEHNRTLSKLVFASSYFDEKFRFFASRENNRVKAEILCLDPSGVLSAMLSAARAVVLFSATLSPIEYFCEVTGLEGAKTLELQSPYERDNLCLVAYDSISTKLADRKASAYDCAEVIAETVSAREGNYIAYFPSYEYMRRVCKLFAGIMPEMSIVMQKQNMSYRERERFISLFRSRKSGAVIGFCVLGGMFSEGIDLAGESLIGTIIVGTGMPQLSAERNIMAAYYDEINERGRDFAYVCPGMNKVMQAAGRVIRSESDRGVIVWIDDRLGDANIKLMLPPHWRHIKYTGDTSSLSAILDSFWEKHAD